jgi:hypothetical protein
VAALERHACGVLGSRAECRTYFFTGMLRSHFALLAVQAPEDRPSFEEVIHDLRCSTAAVLLWYRNTIIPSLPRPGRRLPLPACRVRRCLLRPSRPRTWPQPHCCVPACPARRKMLEVQARSMEK